MKKWKLIALVSSIVVAVAIAVTLIIVFTSDSIGLGKKYKYPSTYPTISNKDDTFISLGDRNITNEDIYNTGILSYGLGTLIDLIDEKIYDLNVSAEEVEKQRKELYATYNGINEEEVTYSEEQTKVFKEQMFLQGFNTDEEIEKAIKLDIARTKYAKAQFVEDIKNYEPTESKPYYFTDAQINTAINKIEDLRNTAKAIYVVFRSSSEAKNLMKELGIDTNNLANGWKKVSGEEFTKEEIVDLFIQMYNRVNHKSITVDDVLEYSSSSLSEISSTISSTVFNSLSSIDQVGAEGSKVELKKCYVLNPENTNYLTGYYYLAIKLTNNTPFTVEQYKEIVKNGTSDEELLAKYNKVHDQLIETALTSSVINSYLYENRGNTNIKIYDERLDFAFYDAFTSGISTIKNPTSKYEKTTKESKDYVAEFIINGETKYITADDIFGLMTRRYGTLVAIQYMNYYLFLNSDYSDVYDFESKTKLEKYTNSYNKNVYTLYEALTNGEYELYGYPASYGWDNFVRDYLGLTNEIDSVVLFEAYDDAVKSYTDSFFTITSPNAEAIYDKLVDAYVEKTISVQEYNDFLETLDASTYENTILYQICKNFTEYFYVKAALFNYYFDHNYDGVADEEEDATKHANAKTLINAMFYLAKNNPKTISNASTSELVLASKMLNAIKSGKYVKNHANETTVESRLNILISIYNNASLNDEIFGVYKDLGIRLSLTANSTYSDSSLESELAEIFKEVWDGVLLNTLVLDNNTKASFPYAQKVNADTNALNCEGITSETPYKVNQLYEENNVTSIVFITQVTNSTWYHYYETKPTDTTSSVKVAELIPSIERLTSFVRFYELSLVDISDLDDKETKEYESLVPIDMEMPFVTNVLGVAYDALYEKDLPDTRLNEIRRDLLEDGTFKFNDTSYKDICIKMMELAFEKNN